MQQKSAVRILAQGLFYGWWIVSAGVVIHAMLSALFMQAYGTYVAVFRQARGGLHPIAPDRQRRRDRDQHTPPTEARRLAECHLSIP